MCFGGGGGGGTITMPDTGAYDRQFDQQLEMMQMAQSTELTGLQSRLQRAQSKTEDVLSKLTDLRTERAENTASVEAEARRMSNIIGPPPPDVSAKAPVIGDAREKTSSTKSGSSSLRIGRKTASSSGQGTGYNLNI